MSDVSFGRAGAGAERLGGRGRAGAAGERRTAEFLARYAAETPHTYVFNALRLPSGVDVDHVVVRGRVACVVDTKVRASGRYWNIGGVSMRGLRPTAGRTTAGLHFELRELGRFMPRRTRAFGAVVFLAAADGESPKIGLLQAQSRGEGIAVLRADQLRGWLDKRLPGAGAQPHAPLLRSLYALTSEGK